MMPEPTTRPGPSPMPARPFPWFCPRCRRQEVRRTTIAYECPRVHNGRTVTVVVPGLNVPRCGNCGELVFDYLAEEEIRRAYHSLTEGLDFQVNGEPPSG